MTLLVAVLALGACRGSTGDACDAMTDDVARENCRLEALGPLYASGDVDAFEAALAKIADPASRDLVRLRLAIQDPAHADRLCREVETEPAEEKCKQVLGRPHLRAPR